MTYQRDHWKEERWLREQQAREQREMLDTIRQKLYHGDPYRDPFIDAPAPKQILIRGDYLIYYLGGPLNATQEYFWDKILPKDPEIRTIPEKEPICVDPTTAPPPDQCVLRSNRYKIVTIPKFETPFSTVQVYLALYQEPPL